MAMAMASSMDRRGIDAVLRDMRQHPEDAKVQEKGCKGLRRLATNNADNKVKIGAGGGVEAIVQAMGGHRGSENVQEQGCWALEILSDDNESNAVKIGAGGGVEAIVQAMEVEAIVQAMGGRFRGNVLLQCVGCSALLSLGRSNRDILQRIKSAGAEEAVQRAIASPIMMQYASESTKKKVQELLTLLRNV